MCFLDLTITVGGIAMVLFVLCAGWAFASMDESTDMVRCSVMTRY